MALLCLTKFHNARSISLIKVINRTTVRGKALRDAKIQLALEIVTRLHGKPQAEAALEHFTQVFQKRDLPDKITNKHLALSEPKLLTHIIKDLAITSSTSEAMRLIKQKAVKIDGKIIEDQKYQLAPENACTLQVGKKHIFRLQT